MVAAVEAVSEVIETVTALLGSKNDLANALWNFIRNLPTNKQTNKNRTKIITIQLQDSLKEVFQGTNLKRSLIIKKLVLAYKLPAF